MKHRAFMKAWNSVCSGIGRNKVFDVSKVFDLNDTQRKEMVEFLVRHRVAVNYTIPHALIPENFDYNWLQCMGYLYQSKSSSGILLVHTSEAKIK